MKPALLNLLVLVGILILCAGVMALESPSASADPVRDKAPLDQPVIQPPRETRIVAMGVGPEPTPTPCPPCGAAADGGSQVIRRGM